MKEREETVKKANDWRENEEMTKYCGVVRKYNVNGEESEEEEVMSRNEMA